MKSDDKGDFQPTHVMPQQKEVSKPGRPLKAFLAILTGEKAGSQYSLPNDSGTVIGRSSECDIHVEDQDASRQHAAIQPIGDEYYLRDMGSTNGTLINGKPVEKRILRHGDKITIGKQVLQFILLDPDGEPHLTDRSIG
ncbi:FHA domain-containing protein [bacterium]|nr:MAG: FHA domain-containing protein [bacterium]